MYHFNLLLYTDLQKKYVGYRNLIKYTISNDTFNSFKTLGNKILLDPFTHTRARMHARTISLQIKKIIKRKQLLKVNSAYGCISKLLIKIKTNFFITSVDEKKI